MDKNKIDASEMISQFSVSNIDQLAQYIEEIYNVYTS